MESEGPYKLVGGVFDGPNGFNFRIVWGPDFKLDSKIIHEEIIKIANQAHAEGRKSMEKELVELLEFVNRIMEFFKHYTYCPRCKSDIDHTDECELENAADSVLINFSRKCIDDFYVWKNARGIE